MNTPPLVERIFGPNWRSTLTGWGSGITAFLAFLAAAPYTLGDVATIISPEWKATIFKISAVAMLVLKCINGSVGKDKVVSGTPGTGQFVGKEGEEPRPVETKP